MARFLFPDFLTDPSQYEQAEALWLARWGELARRTGQAHLWRVPWLNTSFVNGAAFRDGDPIFSAVNSARRLGIRAIQLEPTGSMEQIDFWVDRFASGEPEEISELVISGSLTDYTLSVALDWMYQWMIKGSVRKLHDHFGGPFSLDAGSLATTAGAKVA